MVISLTLPRNPGKLWLLSSKTSILRGRETCSGKQTGEASGLRAEPSRSSFLEGFESHHGPALAPAPPICPAQPCVSKFPMKHYSDLEVLFRLTLENARCWAFSQMLLLCWKRIAKGLLVFGSLGQICTLLKHLNTNKSGVHVLLFTASS
jgi:hypothetical protein